MGLLTVNDLLLMIQVEAVSSYLDLPIHFQVQHPVKVINAVAITTMASTAKAFSFPTNSKCQANQLIHQIKQIKCVYLVTYICIPDSTRHAPGRRFRK